METLRNRELRALGEVGYKFRTSRQTPPHAPHASGVRELRYSLRGLGTFSRTGAWPKFSASFHF